MANIRVHAVRSHDNPGNTAEYWILFPEGNMSSPVAVLHDADMERTCKMFLKSRGVSTELANSPRGGYHFDNPNNSDSWEVWRLVTGSGKKVFGHIRGARDVSAMPLYYPVGADPMPSHYMVLIATAIEKIKSENITGSFTL